MEQILIARVPLILKKLFAKYQDTDTLPTVPDIQDLIVVTVKPNSDCKYYNISLMNETTINQTKTMIKPISFGINVKFYGEYPKYSAYDLAWWLTNPIVAPEYHSLLLPPDYNASFTSLPHITTETTEHYGVEDPRYIPRPTGPPEDTTSVVIVLVVVLVAVMGLTGMGIMFLFFKPLGPEYHEVPVEEPKNPASNQD